MALHWNPLRAAGGPRGRRGTALAAAVVMLATVGGCAGEVRASTAISASGAAFSDMSVQADTAKVIGENSVAQPSNEVLSLLNRIQLTFFARHQMISQAATAQGISVTAEQIAQVRATLMAQSPGTNAASSIELPAGDENDVLRDLVVLQTLVSRLPAAGVQVTDVSVTAQGVPVASRDAAVAKVIAYQRNAAQMDADVIAADTKALKSGTYSLLTAPEAGSAGLFSTGTGRLAVLATGSSYLVLRVTNRATRSAPLTAAVFQAVTTVPQYFDLAALLLSVNGASTNVSVNPRYGLWDPASLQVVPANSGL